MSMLTNTSRSSMYTFNQFHKRFRSLFLQLKRQRKDELSPIFVTSPFTELLWNKLSMVLKQV